MGDATAGADKAEATTPDLDRAIVRGSAWLALTFGSRNVLGLISTAVAARYLVPADFGVVALALAVVFALEQLQEGGMGAAMIYRTELDEQTINTVTAYYGSVALASAGALAILGPGIAWLFDAPALSTLLPVVAVAAGARVFAMVPTAILERRFAFRLVGGVEVLAGLTQAGVVIGFAVAGAGVWALALGQVFGAVVGSAGCWWAARQLPSVRGASWTSYRELRTYARPVMMANIFGMLSVTADNLIVGRLAGATGLGYYSQSFRLSSLPATVFGYVIGRTMLPAYAANRGDRSTIGRLFLVNIQRNLLVIGPPVAVMLFFAGPLLTVFLGDGWSGAFPVLATLAIYGFMRGYAGPSGELFKGVGRPELGARYNGLYLGLMVPALVVSTHLWGASGAAAGMVCVMTLLAHAQLVHGFRLCGLTAKGVLSVLGPAMLCCAAVFAAAALGRWAVGSDHSAGVTLLSGVGISAVAWLVSIRLLAWSAVTVLVSAFKPQGVPT